MTFDLHVGNALEVLPTLAEKSAHTCVTSPPYYKQVDYNHPEQLGLENDLDGYLNALAQVFHGVHRCLVEGGTLWVVIGETYNNFSYVRSGSRDRATGAHHSRRKLETGYREKEPLGVPFAVVDRLRSDGWVHRSINIWNKVVVGQPLTSDKPTLTHEYVLQFVKAAGSGRPYANCKPIPNSVWTFKPESHAGHPCPFPVGLASLLIEASTEPGDIVLDLFAGSGTTLHACVLTGRKALGCEIDPTYHATATKRLQAASAQTQLFAPTT